MVSPISVHPAARLLSSAQSPTPTPLSLKPSSSSSPLGRRVNPLPKAGVYRCGRKVALDRTGRAVWADRAASVLGRRDLLQARQALMRSRSKAGAAQWELPQFSSASSSGAGRDVARSVGDSRQPRTLVGGCGLATVGLVEGGLVSQDGRGVRGRPRQLEQRRRDGRAYVCVCVRVRVVRCSVLFHRGGQAGGSVAVVRQRAEGCCW